MGVRFFTLTAVAVNALLVLSNASQIPDSYQTVKETYPTDESQRKWSAGGPAYHNHPEAGSDGLDMPSQSRQSGLMQNGLQESRDYGLSLQKRQNLDSVLDSFWRRELQLGEDWKIEKASNFEPVASEANARFQRTQKPHERVRSPTSGSASSNIKREQADRRQQQSNSNRSLEKRDNAGPQPANGTGEPVQQGQNALGSLAQQKPLMGNQTKAIAGVAAGGAVTAAGLGLFAYSLHRSRRQRKMQIDAETRARYERLRDEVEQEERWRVSAHRRHQSTSHRDSTMHRDNSFRIGTYAHPESATLHKIVRREEPGQETMRQLRHRNQEDRPNHFLSKDGMKVRLGQKGALTSEHHFLLERCISNERMKFGDRHDVLLQPQSQSKLEDNAPPSGVFGYHADAVAQGHVPQIGIVRRGAGRPGDDTISSPMSSKATMKNARIPIQLNDAAGDMNTLASSDRKRARLSRRNRIQRRLEKRRASTEGDRKTHRKNREAWRSSRKQSSEVHGNEGMNKSRHDMAGIGVGIAGGMAIVGGGAALLAVSRRPRLASSSPSQAIANPRPTEQEMGRMVASGPNASSRPQGVVNSQLAEPETQHMVSGVPILPGHGVVAMGRRPGEEVQEHVGMAASDRHRGQGQRREHDGHDRNDGRAGQNELTRPVEHTRPAEQARTLERTRSEEHPRPHQPSIRHQQSV